MSGAKFPTEKPVWWQDQAPFGSAVREILGLSGFISHVELQVLSKGRSKRRIALGRTEDRAFKQDFVATIHEPSGKLVAKLKIRSIFAEELSDELKDKVVRVAKELGTYWPTTASPR